MAKKRTQNQENPDRAGNQAFPGNGGQSETIAGYFRQVFKENPKLLKERSNAKLLARWMADHPGHSEIPKSVKNSLANLKSVLRSKKRKRIARRAEESQLAESSVPGRPPESRPRVARVPSGSSRLEALELQIDEALIVAKHIDREGLHDVIGLLRRARNEVVWKMGQ
jgi:hypothetical protein